MGYENADIESVFVEVGSSRSGLSENDVTKRLQVSGFNELQEKVRITPAKVLLRQFTNFIVWVLLAAAVISLMIDELVNFGVIILLVAFVIVLGFVQE